MTRFNETNSQELTYQFIRITNTPCVSGGRQQINQPSTPIDADGTEEIVNLNFKVLKSLHRTYKLVAAEVDMKMQTLLQKSLDCFIEHNAEQFGDRSPTMQRRLAEIQTRDGASRDARERA